jgi:hypothetical protein
MLAINTSQAATDQSRIYFWREAKVCAVGKYTPPVRPQTRATIVDDEMERLLDCIAENESSNGKNLYGDYRNGIPMAYGHYQIWLKYHPIGYDCAMDYDCARDYTRRMIEAGRGGEWTSYKDCI